MKTYPKAGTIVTHPRWGIGEVQELFEIFHPHAMSTGSVYVKFDVGVLDVDIEAIKEVKDESH